MATLKIVLRKNKAKKDSTIPLAIRITQDRKSRYIFTGQYIEEKHWNTENTTVRKSHPNSARLNNFLRKKLSEANERIIEAETADKSFTTLDIKKKIKNSAGGSFYDMAELRIQQKHNEGVFSVAGSERSILNNIKKFHKNSDLSFDEITFSFIQRFKTFCKTDLKHKSSRTTTNQLIFIRTVYNMGIKDGVAKTENYPFAGENEKIRLKRSMKIGLSKEEIQKIEALELEQGTGMWHSRNLFLFSFYFAGIRISDVLKMKWDDIKGDRLYYVMNKNEKPNSLKISPKALKVLDEYADPKATKDDFIFPDLKKANLSDPKDIYRKTKTATKSLNKYLKRIAGMTGIEKNLSNHIARHSFGNISGDRIHPLMLQKLYQHSDLKTTINYQANFINRETDDALDAVIGD